MKQKIFLTLLTIGSISSTAYAVPVVYTAEGVASYEQETALWGYVTIDDEIEIHTTDMMYCSYTILDFQIYTNHDTWVGSSGILHWEAEGPSYEAPYDRAVGMASFIDMNSSGFYFQEDGGVLYPMDEMERWLTLPSEIQIWSDFLYQTDASYVSFTLHAPAPIPEPATVFLFGAGVVGFAGIFINRDRKLCKGR